MATFLDVTGLAHFSKFFVFIMVWLIVYAILKTTKVIGEHDGISIVVGLVIALLVLFSPIATSIVEITTPWFAVLFIFIIFSTIALHVLGVKTSDVMGSQSLKFLFGIIILIIMVVGAVSYARQQVSVPGDNETSLDVSTTTGTLFHPTMLGVIFVLLIAVFTIVLLAGKQR